MLVAFDVAGERASWAFEGKPGSAALEIGRNIDSRMECTQNQSQKHPTHQGTACWLCEGTVKSGLVCVCDRIPHDEGFQIP